ncbi:restriction endonuclease subunit S [Paenibacillus profundus]|uniref:Restriction endonuclease subunit S n=1 Tax=Paenibacillus profundus TaxID=1173085 RepID=A0ABS8YQE7_9BACL|nr:restriction endonuclease subunit S [Paenibacillus profundus]MCE5171819.1 restriction endonuclease subunit S [Paenibacillus profundus]
MSKWESVKLGDVCTGITDGSHNPPEGIEFSEYLMLSSKNINNGSISFHEPRYLSEKDFIIEDKRTSINVGDVLLTIVGTIGRTAVVPDGIPRITLQRSVAVLKPSLDLLDSNFLMYTLMSIAPQLIRSSRGVAQKGIYLKQVRSFEIPLPPLETQKEIAKTLDTAAELLAMRKKQLAELDKLIKSIFYDMFGDPVLNEKGWEVAELSSLGDVSRGVSKHRPRNEPSLLGGTHPLIQTGDIAQADFIIREYKQTYSDIGLAQSRKWPVGTLCITIAANIAKTAILGFDACFPDSVVGFTSNERTNNIFVLYWFSFFQKIIEAQAPESAQKNINLKILNELNVIVPPTNLQNQFAAIVTQIEKQKALLQKAIDETQYLFDSLMSEYFE